MDGSAHTTRKPRGSMNRQSRDRLQAIIDDLAPRLRDLPVIATMRSGADRVTMDQARDAQLTRIIHRLRRAHDAHIALGGNVQRIAMAGVGAQTTAGTANLLRLWLATARARLDPAHPGHPTAPR